MNINEIKNQSESLRKSIVLCENDIYCLETVINEKRRELNEAREEKAALDFIIYCHTGKFPE